MIFEVEKLIKELDSHEEVVFYLGDIQVAKHYSELLVNIKTKTVTITNPEKDVIELYGESGDLIERTNVRW